MFSRKKVSFSLLSARRARAAKCETTTVSLLILEEVSLIADYSIRRSVSDIVQMTISFVRLSHPEHSS
jgi:hypothetical protein